MKNLVKFNKSRYLPIAKTPPDLAEYPYPNTSLIVSGPQVCFLVKLHFDNLICKILTFCHA